MSYSFDITNARDFLIIFSKSVDDYLIDPLSTEKAVICAMFAWHVADWVYNEYAIVAAVHGKIIDFQQFIKLQCPSLGLMQDVANGTKHRAIARYTPTVKQTNVHHGALSNAFGKGFDVSSLTLTMGDGSVVYFDEEVDKVRNFWHMFFSSTLRVPI